MDWKQSRLAEPDAVASLVNSQVARNRVFILVLILGALVNAALPGLLLAALTDSAIAGVVTFGVLALAALCVLAFATDPASGIDAHGPDTPAERHVQSVVARVAARLGTPPPTV